jgi:hypothetical protein
MTKDRALEELYEIRSRILSEHSADLRNYMRSEFERLKSEGHPIARINQRGIRHAEATQSNESRAQGDSSPSNDRH